MAAPLPGEHSGNGKNWHWLSIHHLPGTAQHLCCGFLSSSLTVFRKQISSSYILEKPGHWIKVKELVVVESEFLHSSSVSQMPSLYVSAAMPLSLLSPITLQAVTGPEGQVCTRQRKQCREQDRLGFCLFEANVQCKQSLYLYTVHPQNGIQSQP